MQVILSLSTNSPAVSLWVKADLSLALLSSSLLGLPLPDRLRQSFGLTGFLCGRRRSLKTILLRSTP